MIRRYGSIALLALAVFAAPRFVRAQEIATAPATSADAALPASPLLNEQPATLPVVGPTLDGATAGFHRATIQTVHAPVTVAAARASSSTALMIVGGAAFLAGAIISSDNSSAGTVIMVGGAAVGLYGLYLYLQ